jgi:undecaprenyl-diphosphatase
MNKNVAIQFEPVIHLSTLIQLLYAIIIGLIQGISEWLPISSKTQIMVASSYLFNINLQQAYTFGLFMEIGTVAAAIIYFRTELYALIQVLLGSKDKAKRKLFVYVLTATLITGIIGAPLYLIADSLTGISVGIPMLLIGAVLIGDALLVRHSRKNRKGAVRKFDDLKLKDYIIVGAVQGIAALPGVSRSGITTSAMLLMNVEPDEAFRLSFLVGIFAAIAAFSLTLIATHANVSIALQSIGLEGLIVAIITSTIASLFLIDFLIKVAGKSQIVYLTAILGVIAMASGLLYLALGL